MIKFAFGLWLQSCGVHLIFLGLFNLIFLPFSLKILWMPLLESRFKPFAKYGNRKSWMIFFESLIVVMVFGFAFIDPKTYNLFFILIYAMSLAGLIATKEALVIAYQMETIKAENWGSTEGRIGAAYHVGFWMGGILIFLSSSIFAWNHLFILFAIILFSFLVITFHIPDSEFHVKPKDENIKEKLIHKIIDPYKELIKTNKKILFSLMAFIALYRLQDRILSGISNYFFIELKFSNLEFVAGKTLGIFCLILGGLLASASIKKIGYKKTMVVGMIWHAIAASLFVVQSLLPKSHFLFYNIMIFEKLTRGFEGTVFFTYQMLFCSKYYIMTQLSMLLALDKLGGSLVGSLSGLLVSVVGWAWFFIFTFIGTIPSLFLLKRLPEKRAQESNT